MKFPRHLATTAARGSGLVRADVGAQTATGDAGSGALAKLGGDIRSFGSDMAAIQQHKQKISDSAEIDRVNSERDIWIAARNDATKQTRSETPADQRLILESLRPEYNKMMAGALKGTSKGVQDGINSTNEQVFAGFHNGTRRITTAKILNHVKATKTTAALAKARAGDIEGANGDVDYMLKNSVMLDTEAAALRVKITEEAKEGLEGDVIGAGLAAWKASIPKDGSNPDGDLQDAFDVVQKSDVPSQDKGRVESELKRMITNRRAEAKLKLEADQEESRDGINDAIFKDKNYDEANKLINSSPLGEAEQTALFKLSDQRAAAAANGTKIKNDYVEEERLYQKALRIGRGVTKGEFDADLAKNATRLDETAYGRVSSTGATTLKTSQAKDLSRASIEARGQLVDFQSEDAAKAFLAEAIKGMNPDPAKLFEQNFNKNRAKQLRALSDFNAELRDWQSDPKNKDKTGKEFFVYSRGLENEYKLAKDHDNTVAELRSIRPDLKAVPVNTQEEYDKLPSGTKYIDKNGNMGTKR